MIGGTEFFGKRAVERFLEEGWRVTVLSRGQRRPAWWDRVEHLLCDRTDRAAFAKALHGRTFDVVVDNIAYDVQNVASALEVLRGATGHYILTSTGAVYDPPPEDRRFSPVQEQDATLVVRPDDTPYGAGKKRAERTLLDRADDLPFTVVRPTVVQGPEDPTLRPWFWVQRILDGGPLLVPDDWPEPAWNHAYRDDVAELLVRAAGNPVAFGKAYNAAGTDTTTLVDYLRTAARTLGRDPEIVRVPVTVLRAALPTYRPPFGRRFVLDITRAVAELGYAPTPAARWIPWTVEDFAGASGLPASAGYADRAAELTFARSWSGAHA